MTTRNIGRGARAGGRERASTRTVDRADPASGQQGRNDLPAMAAIEPEVSVGSEDDGSGQDLCHSYETGVRETHRNLAVLSQQGEDRCELASKVEAKNDSAAAQELIEGHFSPAPEQVKYFR